jgi:hypothetical protein
MDSPSRIRLAAAHATMLIVVLTLSVAVWFLQRGAGGAALSDGVARAATWFRAAALGYLVMSLVSEAVEARRLRNLPVIQAPPIALLLGHLWVLMVAGAALARGPSSRAMLARCDAWIAVLLAVSGPALVLTLVTWWLSRRSNGFRATNDRVVTLKDRLPAWLTGASGLLVVVALWYLETRTL